MAHAFVNGMWAGFLLPCLIVGLFVAGVYEVFTLSMASSLFGHSRLMMVCPCPQLTHFSVRVLLSLHWVDASSGAIPAVWTSDLQGKLLAVEALQWFSDVRYQPVTSVSPCKSGGGVLLP